MHESQRVSWQLLMEEVCKLKEALDHASRWASDYPEYEWWFPVLQEHGVNAMHLHSRAVARAHSLSMPDHYAEAMLGRWANPVYYYTASLPPVQSAFVPAWAVIGWARKAQYRGTPALERSALVQMANDLQADSQDTSAELTEGFEGLDLYIAREGKNRTQLLRLAGVPRKTNLRLFPMPDLTGATLRPLAFFPSISVLFHDGELSILPFGELSSKLLGALGVELQARPTLVGFFRLGRMCRLNGLQALLTLLRHGADGLRLELLWNGSVRCEEIHDQ